jgi:hypothetical protein
MWESTDPLLESTVAADTDSYLQDPDSTVSNSEVYGYPSAITLILLWYDVTDPQAGVLPYGCMLLSTYSLIDVTFKLLEGFHPDFQSMRFVTISPIPFN